MLGAPCFVLGAPNRFSTPYPDFSHLLREVDTCTVQGNVQCIGPRNGLESSVPVKILTFWGPGTFFKVFWGPGTAFQCDPVYFHHCERDKTRDDVKYKLQQILIMYRIHVNSATAHQQLHRPGISHQRADRKLSNELQMTTADSRSDSDSSPRQI